LSSAPKWYTYDDDHHHHIIVVSVKSWPRNNTNPGQWRISPTLLYCVYLYNIMLYIIMYVTIANLNKYIIHSQYTNIVVVTTYYSTQRPPISSIFSWRILFFGQDAFAIDFFHLINRHIYFDIILHIIGIIIPCLDRNCERKSAARISRPQIVIKRLLLRII